MSDILMLQLEYLLRMTLSAVLGGVIGIERERRGKEAGIRTHLIVSLASCLMMLVSKYGFYDMLSQPGMGLDPSRVAAGIVTGVGFLGAGVIFVRGRAVNGLTTAAGVWATVGVGMAVGAGMYAVSAAATVLIVIFQALLHRDLSFLRKERDAAPQRIRIQLDARKGALALLSQSLERLAVTAVSLQAERQPDGGLSVLLELQPSRGGACPQLLSDLLEEEFVQSVEWSG